MWMQYPDCVELYSVDNQYLIGSDLLVSPVTEAGVTECDVHFPPGHMWYDAETLVRVSSNVILRGVETVKVRCDIDTGIPVYQRGGSILARKLRLRRSAKLMKTDPYTLYIALDSEKKAFGSLYMDDEETFGHYMREEYAQSTFAADFSDAGHATISNSAEVGEGWVDDAKEHAVGKMIERIVVMGLDAAPHSILQDSNNVDFHYDADAHLLVLRKPYVSAMLDWTITIAV